MKKLLAYESLSVLCLACVCPIIFESKLSFHMPKLYVISMNLIHLWLSYKIDNNATYSIVYIEAVHVEMQSGVLFKRGDIAFVKQLILR